MRKRINPGFTIVELLIVIVVIGILAAITIVAYNGIQERARASSVSSALSQATKKFAVYQVDNPDIYPADKAALDAIGIKDTSDVTYQYTRTPGSPDTYCLTATTGTTSYKISSSTTTPVAGACAGHGAGGVAPITNLAINPSVETNSTNWAERWYGAGGGAGSMTRTGSAALYGSYGLRKTWTTAGGGQDIGMQYITPVTAGKTYTFSAYIRGSITTNHKAFIAWRDGTNTQIGSTVNGPEITIPANTWQRLSVSGAAPAGAATVTFVWGPYPSSGSPTAVVGQTLDFDGLMITESATAPTYADGTSANWIWNGAAHSSTSTGPAL
jgi:prepilin-type N-terminal cleavage/methylation domain-containing protein